MRVKRAIPKKTKTPPHPNARRDRDEKTGSDLTTAAGRDSVRLCFLAMIEETDETPLNSSYAKLDLRCNRSEKRISPNRVASVTTTPTKKESGR